MKKAFLQTKSVKFKILAIPLTAIFIAILVISGGVISITKNKMMEQMEYDGMIVANQAASQLQMSSSALDIINSNIENNIRTLGNFLKNNSSSINNQYLTYMAKSFDVDEINVTDSTGKIIYSNLQSSLGQIFGSNHIAYSVLKGEKNELMENIRKSRETDDYYKYGYIRKNDGGFIQIGILANKVQKFSDSVGYQSFVDGIKKDKNVVYALFIDKNLKVIANTNRDRIGVTLDDIGSKTAILEGKLYSSEYFYKAGNVKVYDVIVPIKKGNEVIGAVDIGLSLKNVESAINRVIMVVSIISIIAFAVIATILIFVSRGVINPLNKLVLSSEQVAKGELYHNIEVNSKDEIGVLSKSFKDMVESLKEIISNIQDKTQKTDAMSIELTSTSNQLSSAANEVALAIQEVAQGASVQANDLMDAINYMSSLAEEIDNIHNKMEFVKDNVDGAKEKANSGKENIDLLLAAFNDISKAFKVVSDKVNVLSTTISKIGNITDVINGISEQTNLLALNAAIEAARAGELGRGFAVVAEEVRKLAQESRASTEEIKNLVHSITSETQEVIDTSKDVEGLLNSQVQSVEQTINSFRDILEAISKITPLIDDTYVSIDKTISSKNIVLDKVSSVSSVAQEMSASTEEISASSEEMLASAQEVARYAEQLSEIAAELNKKVNEFKM
jgi:methyl-accepting chemotaxis protein